MKIKLNSDPVNNGIVWKVNLELFFCCLRILYEKETRNLKWNYFWKKNLALKKFYIIEILLNIENCLNGSVYCDHFFKKIELDFVLVNNSKQIY